ncbi:MAG: hypothetical protein R3E79_57775 [Caldilineaceae bacterium]
MNNTKEQAEKPVLLSEIVKVMEKSERLYSQKRVYLRMMGLVMAELMAFGRPHDHAIVAGVGEHRG